MAEEKKQVLFRVAQPEEIRVKIELEQDGEAVSTLHIFRPPSAVDRKNYYSRLSYMEMTAGGGQRQVSGVIEASEQLYDACIKQVEGVDFGGAADWKQALPIEIKRAAVVLLMG